MHDAISPFGPSSAMPADAPPAPQRLGPDHRADSSASFREVSIPPVASPSPTPSVSAGEETPRLKLQRKQNEVFDLDLVKRKIRPKSAASLMSERKSRARGVRAFLMVVFFPWHIDWWNKRVPETKPWLRYGVGLYIAHILTMVRLALLRSRAAPVELIEVLMPVLLLVVLGVLMGQAAVAQTVEGSSRPGVKRDSSSERKLASSAFSGGSNTPPLTPSSRLGGDGGGDSGTSDDSMDSDEERDTGLPAEAPVVMVRRASQLGHMPNPVALGAGGGGGGAGAAATSPSTSSPSTSSPNPSTSAAKKTSPRNNGDSSSALFSPSVGSSSVVAAASLTVPAASAHAPPQRPPLVQQLSGTFRLGTSPRAGRPVRPRFPGWRRKQPKQPVEDPNNDVASVASMDNMLQINQVEETDGDSDGDFSDSDLEANGDEPNRYRRQTLSQEDILDSVKSVHWSANGPEKVLLSPAQIRAEIEKKIDAARPNDFYGHLATIGAVMVALCPVLFRAWNNGSLVTCTVLASVRHWLEYFELGFPNRCESCDASLGGVANNLLVFVDRIIGLNPLDTLTVLICALGSVVLARVLLGTVAGAVDTFKRRYLYAKYFAMLTSSRRARKADLPHFRLHRVDHIRVWLTLRSRRMDMDRNSLGPYRASDATAHAIVMFGIFLVGAVAIRALQRVSDGGDALNPSNLNDVILMLWAGLLALYVQRVLSLATKTHEKFSNTSILLTEELNIHMRLLRKPHKRDELSACNQMLKVANSLIKELEGSKSKKGSGGLILDPWLYSLIRVTLLSALGALSSDLFGFRVRMWKL